MECFIKHTISFYNKNVGMCVTDGSPNDWENMYDHMLVNLLNIMGFDCLSNYILHTPGRDPSSAFSQPMVFNSVEGPMLWVGDAGGLCISHSTSNMAELMSYFERVFGSNREDYPVYLMVPTAQEIKRARGGAVCMSWVWFCQDWDDSLEFV